MYDSRTNQLMSKIKLLEKSIQKQVALTINIRDIFRLK